MMTMWQKGWRDEIWSQIDQQFDLVVIGGGITGAGVFLESVRAGLKTLLVEAHDFSSGTSSRSSKLVHGGFRYLKNGQLKITYDSVREREQLLRENRGLINQLGFVIASYKGNRIPLWALGFGLTFYDLLAFKWGHKYYDSQGMLELCPYLNTRELQGGYRYIDALTDDARLVLRTIQDGVKLGGLALNYVKVERIASTRTGKISGVFVKDMTSVETSRQAEIRSKAVVNATGAWTDHLMGVSNKILKNLPKIRRLRGSHLIFPADKLPINRAISIWHPNDKRPVFTIPWEGVTIVGTTDIDCIEHTVTDPCISSEEVEYLLDAIRFTFPSLNLGAENIQSTFSGIRSVIDTGRRDPSKESREHFIRFENGLLTIGGGKLTTFRLMARQAIKLLRKNIPDLQFKKTISTTSTSIDPPLLSEAPIDQKTKIRLAGRYGLEAAERITNSDPSELTSIGSSPNLWAEIRWAARAEGIVHLEDLLLRRVRLGILLPAGGIEVIGKIKKIVKEELGWNENRWEMEFRNYKLLLERSYSKKLS
jgi:glycerol-3-phosphate dehydrogenase